MPTLKNKVFAYITSGRRLCVFVHPDSPEAGIQVPAGTVKDGETAEQAVMREAVEETGLSGLRLLGFLGQCNHDVPARDEIHRRRFYHVMHQGHPPARWKHFETDPGDGSAEPILFEFFWAELPDDVPELAPGHDRMLPKLVDRMSVDGRWHHNL